MRARRCTDGLLDSVYLKAETEGATGSGVRLWMRSLEGGGRGRAEMGYLVSDVMQARFKLFILADYIRQIL
jgi:hypothetical protein